MWYARDAGVLDLGRNEQRYVRIAQLVRDTTEPNSVIITLQHSGSVRYYGERVTLRYEVLHDRWLDKINCLAARERISPVHPSRYS